MEYSEQTNIVLKDPLSPISRKTRRNLLISSLITVFIVYSGLIPTKITSLGIEFSNANKSYILIVLGCVVVYFITAFYVSGIADYRIWKQLANEESPYLTAKSRIIELDELLSYDVESQEEKHNMIVERAQLKKELPKNKIDRNIGFIRSLGFEILLPFLIGTVAVGSVLANAGQIDPA
ncbi:MAG: hypothetical protein K8R63_06860 [Bacteroidales bacterium]|nr:hypothetical protein [Bacteroidales bacterium]